MRIVIDMQGAQTGSRFRGIGRYVISITQAILRNRGEHEIILLLSGLFPETIESIRSDFQHLLPQEKILVWHAPGPVFEADPDNENRRLAAEIIREAFIESLEPDVIHVHSLFEGYDDDAVLSIGRFDSNAPVSATFHDLIPLHYPKQYLEPNYLFAKYYYRKIDDLKRASLYLAISESSRIELIDALNIPPENVVNTYESVESNFKPLEINLDEAFSLKYKFGLSRSFVLYTGGSDPRKNLPRLIQAFSELPEKIRNDHQLVFAGKLPQGNIDELESVALKAGLRKDELRFTGYVTDQELIRLYNLCKLYVFPSWHEGFGLPVLEAMACGAPVIGSNTSSLPEVIGSYDALFDPFDTKSISKKMAEVLRDEEFRQRLIAHGKRQVCQFSWDISAKRAICAWVKFGRRQCGKYYRTPLSVDKTHRQIVDQLTKPSKLVLGEIANCLALNEQAGILRQLLLDVSEIRNYDAATGVQRVVRSYLKALLQAPPDGFQVVPVYATRAEGYRYAWKMVQRYGEKLPDGLFAKEISDRIPIRWQRGDIFFALDMQHHVQLAHKDFFRQLQVDGVTVKFLVHDLLPIQLVDMFKDEDAKQLHEQWLSMVAATDGAICVSKATADAYNEWIDISGIYRTPGFRMAYVHNGGDLDGSNPSVGLPLDADEVLEKIRQRPTFLTVSTLEPRKCQDLLFAAIQGLWASGHDVNLVLVGKQGWKVDELAKTLREHPENGRRLFWLEGISDEYLEEVYRASSALVAVSINEGFGLSLIEAARYDVPIIARDIPVFHEVAQSSAFYFQGNTGQELAIELEWWLELLDKGEQPNSKNLHWQTWAQSAELLKRELVVEHYPRRQLLVDISELVQHDARSGIQRVVRSILSEWLSNPPQGFRVEPVYAGMDDGYRYARSFVQEFMGWPSVSLKDELIDYAPGDVFFGLDMQPQVQVAQQPFYQKMRRQGVKVKFLLHDLLPIQMPEFFSSGNKEGFVQWLESIAATDGVICVSRTVADELHEWIAVHGPKRERPLQIGWSHNGADIDNSAPSKGIPDDAFLVIETLESRPSFLMVGTLEPRKGHAWVIDVFERVWHQGKDFNLTIVGKKGWEIDGLAERIKSHPEFNQRLFWLAGISDEYLEKVYSASICLIAASYGEGFGLPLIEAAQNGLPIIARDIPVFREVAGSYAKFLPKDINLEDSAEFIIDWMKGRSVGNIESSNSINWVTWERSAKNLFSQIMGGSPIN